MGRRIFTPEFRLGGGQAGARARVSQAQAARDLGVHYNVLRKWVSDAKRDTTRASGGHGKLRVDDAEVARLRASLRRPSPSGIFKKNVITLFAKEPR